MRAILLSLSLLLATAFAPAQAQNAALPGLTEGKDYQLIEGGKPYRAAAGKIEVAEVFAYWCPHCNAEAPHLRALYQSLPKSRYAFLSVNGDGEDPASVFAYHRYFGLQSPALLDPGGNPGSFHQPGTPGRVSTAYHLQYFPTFYVIDPTGRIAWGSDGEQPDALLRQELTRAAVRG